MPSIKPFLKRLAMPASVFAGVLFLDQSLKIISCHREECQKNYGALFGWKVCAYWVMPALIALIVLILWRFRSEKKRVHPLPLALLLAGIISNLLDRVLRGYIVDYINLSSLYIFNLADLAILLGAGFFIWKIIQE